MGAISFPIAGVTIIAVISLSVTMAPATVEDLTQGELDTSQLQQTTNISAGNVDANATEGTDAVNQASGLVQVLSSPETGNRLLGTFFSIILIGLIAWIAWVIWVG